MTFLVSRVGLYGLTVTFDVRRKEDTAPLKGKEALSPVKLLGRDGGCWPLSHQGRLRGLPGPEVSLL